MQQLRPRRRFPLSWGRLALLLLLVAAAASCGHDPALAQLQKELDLLKGKVRAHDDALSLLRSEDKKLWRGLRCNDPQVADFMLEAEKCEGGQCPQRSLNRVLDFMIRQKHVLVRLRAEQTPKDMAPLRQTQLQELLSPQQVTSVSRLLLMTMQVKLTGDAAVRLPEAMGDQLVMHLRHGLNLAKETPRLGPFPVTCDEKTQLLDRYARSVQQDKPVREEPKSNEPQVVIWVFRVDC